MDAVCSEEYAARDPIDIKVLGIQTVTGHRLELAGDEGHEKETCGVMGTAVGSHGAKHTPKRTRLRPLNAHGAATPKRT